MSHEGYMQKLNLCHDCTRLCVTKPAYQTTILRGYVRNYDGRGFEEDWMKEVFSPKTLGKIILL
jgi:hypothetical protein